MSKPICCYFPIVMLTSSILNQPADQFCIHKMVEYATTNVSSARKGTRSRAEVPLEVVSCVLQVLWIDSVNLFSLVWGVGIA